MLYFIKTLSKEGVNSYSFVSSFDIEDLESYCENNNFILINYKELPDQLSFLLEIFKKNPKPDDIIELLDNLHLIVKTGLPLLSTLNDLSKETKNKAFKELILHLSNSINRGKSFSQSLKKYEKVVGQIVLTLIEVGEESGKLDFTLERSSNFLKKIRELKKKVKSALIYPIISMIVVFAAMLTWMLYVLPQMTSLFKTMDVELPPLTLFMISASSFINEYIYDMSFIGIAFITIFIVARRQSVKFQYYIDFCILKIPIIKSVISDFNTAFIGEYMNLAISSGLPINTAIESLSANIKNKIYKEGLKKIAENVAKGKRIDESFLDINLFSSFTIRMITVGLETGALDKQFETISSHYYQRVDYFANNIGKIIEPTLIIFVGGFMALVVMALMNPMYDLVSKVG